MVFDETISPRARLIIDNDFGGDPDGLFQLAHHLLSPTMDVRGVIGSQHYEGGFYGLSGSAEQGAAMAIELVRVMRLDGRVPVLAGAPGKLADLRTPARSAAAELIVREAMRDDTETPLYVACGAGLTNLASAYLLEPRIGRRLRLVWIGGPEHDGLALPPPGEKRVEYNLGIDPLAAQVVFNVSDIPLWQVPRDAYRQAMVGYAELVRRVKGAGPTGAFLMARLDDLLKRAGRRLGETYVLGDSPLVLLTALQSSWEVDPASSGYAVRRAPGINEAGGYEANPDGREIRVYTRLDTRLMFEDFFAKLALFAGDAGEWTEAEGRALHARLLAGGEKVAVAESLTVGRVQAELGRWSGASGYFAGGVTCYTREAKVRLLGVDAAHASEVNAVSARVAEEMARGVAVKFACGLGVATTGYAEPDAGRGVAVPFAWVAVARGAQVVSARVGGAGAGREAMQARATAAALRLLAGLAGAG